MLPGASAFSDTHAEFMRVLYNTLCGYAPKPYRGRVLLYRSTTQPLHQLMDTERPWRAIAPDMEVVTVRGTHVNIIEEPHVRAIADDLGERLTNCAPGAPDRPRPGRAIVVPSTHQNV